MSTWTSKTSEAVGTQNRYRLAFKNAALAEWNALDGSVKALFQSALKKRLINPHVPGSALRDGLKGCYKIKLSRMGYRLVYNVQDDTLTVLVLSVGKRENNEAYRKALKRLLRSGSKPDV